VVARAETADAAPNTTVTSSAATAKREANFLVKVSLPWLGVASHTVCVRRYGTTADDESG
jgi:hypothetical protein